MELFPYNVNENKGIKRITETSTFHRKFHVPGKHKSKSAGEGGEGFSPKKFVDPQIPWDRGDRSYL